MERVKRRFSADDFKRGLEVLDEEMGKDDWLIAFAPITLISTGGFLATNYFHNRDSTSDLDYLLEPQWASDNDVKRPLQKAMVRTANQLGFTEDWVNDDMAFFIPEQSREDLFEMAEEQNIVLWEGTNLRVLAVPLEYALERKLRRIHNSRRHVKRGSDIVDVVAILKHLRTQNESPLSREHIRTLNICSFEMPPDNTTMNEIAAAYREQHSEEAFD
ncbi:uncharacterized protein N7498_000705 [Penicillium cinerascens]|uniref:DUF7582 domain-containing protein n=1 Tax=Penicillium cinerascens TaxID=70096 RepID=A0A9W9NEY8_9EURO|nr:uncharacterized protein N7498_000705 [Penicillium cinerascens]KAJ5218606.1 hypothetical protein N7498_000705 [Penicillium cinerascens]